MMMSSTATLERPAVAQVQAAGIKTILFHVLNDPALDSRLETALSVARTCSAHLTCLHVTPIEAYVAFDGFGGVFVMNDIIKTLDEEDLRLRGQMEQKLSSEDVPWDYVQVTGNVPTQIVRHAALADLIIAGRAGDRSGFAAPALSLLGDLLYRSRTPLLVPASEGGPVDVTGNAVIAWNATHEAANAVRSAVGLLKLASSVRVVQVLEEVKNEAFPAKRLLQYLSRHEIHAELQVEPIASLEPEAVVRSLLERARSADADYMVMGGYNHSRVGEYLFGGVTRMVLKDCTLPVFIAH